MQLNRPIFIVGTGRCGSTIFHRMFTYHPQIAFLSGQCVLYPDRPKYNRRAMQLLDVPFIDRLARKHFQPAEHWPFWDFYVRGFSSTCRDLLASDVRHVDQQRITRALEQILTRRRHRLLIKLTGWPRMGFLAQIFPGALFVHVVRDGRAVANSLLNVDFWQGWGGPGRLGLEPLSDDEQEEWRRSGRSFVVLAAIQWKRWMGAFEEAKRHIGPEQYLEIKYEDFTADPLGTFDDILTFCRLSPSAEFRRSIRKFDVRSQNAKWRRQLTDAQQRQLNDSLRSRLEQYGYELSASSVATADRHDFPSN
jgi:hypothetical protein